MIQRKVCRQCGTAKLPVFPGAELAPAAGMFTPRIFLLSPAYAGGKRGQLVMRDAASFPLAQRLRQPGGAPLGEVFSFLSGLYFRGKMAYIRRFAAPPPGLPGALVITPTRGLVTPDSVVTLELLREFAAGAVELDNPGYRNPLETHARALAAACGDARVVLLGSIASGKYVDVLSALFGARLVFPAAFVGRGDMSRGSLMLRAAEAGEELEYLPVAGAVRHGARPPRLAPRRWTDRR
jgi:hypothetical protein